MEKQRSKVQAKPKKLNFLDSTKAKTFNRMFQENLSMVMTFDKIKGKLKSHPVHVTRVNRFLVDWLSVRPHSRFF